jgi:predicted HAD superfamily phosphohydrolase YqeG
MRPVNPALYQPEYRFSSLAAVDFRLLHKERGITHVLLDLDSTLAEQFSWLVPEQGLDNLRDAMDVERTIREACILSNVGVWPYAVRAVWIAAWAGLPVHCCAWPGPMKPNPVVYTAALRHFESPPSDPRQVAIIGDQYWTDMALAEAVGAVGVLVDPLGWVSQRKRAKHKYYQLRLGSV